MKHAEYVALYANQTPAKSKIKIAIGPDTEPDNGCKTSSNRGPGVGWIALWGSLTEHQRDKMLSHLNRYAELLVKECEDEIKFRDEWDSHQ